MRHTLGCWRRDQTIEAVFRVQVLLGEEIVCGGRSFSAGEILSDDWIGWYDLFGCGIDAPEKSAPVRNRQGDGSKSLEMVALYIFYYADE